MASDSDFELVKIRFRKLYKKAQKLGIKDKDLHNIDFLQKYQEKKLNIVTIIFKWSVVLMFILVLAAFILFGAVKFEVVSSKSVAQASTIFTGVDLDVDQCIYPFSEIFLDVFRPPVDCSVCRNVTGFDIRQNLDPKEFIEKYAYTGRPLIVTDAQTNWTAKTKFSFDYFKDIYKKDSPVFGSGSEGGCQFFPYQTNFISLSEVFKMPKQRLQMKGKPWYIGWSNCDPKAANILRQHYTRPYFLSPEMESSRTDWIFMGTPGYGAHMHIDAVQQSSWQAQIKGDKTWILEPPPECYHECIGFKYTVKAGETVILDTNKWFHGTVVEGNELSIVIGSEYD